MCNREGCIAKAGRGGYVGWDRCRGSPSFPRVDSSGGGCVTCSRFRAAAQQSQQCLGTIRHIIHAIRHNRFLCVHYAVVRIYVDVRVKDPRIVLFR